MTSLKTWAAVAAILGGMMTLSGAASAAPVTAGGLATGTGSDLVSTVQWGGGWGYGGGYGRGYGYRRHWGPRPYYRRWGYGSRVVCRVHYTPWGPRRNCFRRW
jgi:hypothetical protein